VSKRDTPTAETAQSSSELVLLQKNYLISEVTINYIGYPASNREASVEFTQRGLLFRKLHLVNQFLFTPIVFTASLYSVGFMGILPYILFSAFLGILTPVIDAYDISVAKWPTLPAPAFNIVFSIAEKPLTAEHMGKYGLEKAILTGQHPNCYILRHATNAMVIALMGTIKTDGYTLETNVGIKGKGISIQALSSYTMISRVYNAFLSVKFQEGCDDDTDGPIRYHIGKIVKISPKTKEPSYEIDEDGNGRIEIGETRMNDFNLSDMDEGIPFVQAMELSPGCIPLEDAIEETSHLFAFIPKTLPHDHQFILDVFMANFATFLGTGGDAVLSGMSNLEGCLKSLSGTVHMEYLVFVSFIISIAIRTHCSAKLFYSGNTLLGAQVLTGRYVSLFGRKLLPTAGTDVRNVLKELVTMSYARDKVAAALSAMALAGKTRKVTITGNMISDFSSLVEQIRLRERMNKAEAAAIKSYIPYLFDTYEVIPATLENIAKVLGQISESVISTKGFASETLFTEPDLVLSSNLSSFGPLSISFMNIGGRSKDLFSDPTDDPNTTRKVKRMKKVKGEKARGGQQKVVEVEVPYWEVLRVTRLSVDLAVADWKAMTKGKRILQYEGDDGKQLGNVDTHPFPAARDVLTALRKFGGKPDEERAAKRVKYMEAPKVGESVARESDVLFDL